MTSSSCGAALTGLTAPRKQETETSEGSEAEREREGETEERERAPTGGPRHPALESGVSVRCQKPRAAGDFINLHWSDHHGRSSSHFFAGSEKKKVRALSPVPSRRAPPWHLRTQLGQLTHTEAKSAERVSVVHDTVRKMEEVKLHKPRSAGQVPVPLQVASAVVLASTGKL